ncbi:MAG: tRNA (adenosine(37)-N6)-dimethylallyltransferase MiaA [Prevotellaceae bacterium]|nr:tRNA (adenosine(37)-N6)-dimethylallyltransferase MiaA [Prevotellaceae bacterium]
MKKLYVILGPTGVGKTEKTLSIARRLGVPVINADSRQIFREIPIGTAAPTPEQQREVKHFFVGNHSLEDYYSAAQYEADVLELLNEQFLTSDTALMSGGSMMYIDAVCKGIDDIPTVDDDTRNLMKQRLAEEGIEVLLEELKRLDPEHYAIVDHHNPRRIVHALEICHMTGKTYTSFRTGTVKKRPFEIIKIGLNRPREEMYERINQRVLVMMEQGLEAEARSVYAKRHLNSLNTVGFKEMFKYFDGDIDLQEAIRQIQSNSRRYMRKQITWFQHDDTIKWYHPDDEIIL